MAWCRTGRRRRTLPRKTGPRGPVEPEAEAPAIEVSAEIVLRETAAAAAAAGANEAIARETEATTYWHEREAEAAQTLAEYEAEG